MYVLSYQYFFIYKLWIFYNNCRVLSFNTCIVLQFTCYYYLGTYFIKVSLYITFLAPIRFSGLPSKRRFLCLGHLQSDGDGRCQHASECHFSARHLKTLKMSQMSTNKTWASARKRRSTMTPKNIATAAKKINIKLQNILLRRY